MIATQTPREIAVIDIGSNSVRLVLYRIEGRAVWTVFNEKVLAGLGRELGLSGRLSPEGTEQAMTALRRFAAVIDGVQPERTIVAATAAIREAADGQAFCDLVAAQTGLKVRVLSGQEEARYSALGVLAGAPDARGVAADMGGASLELTHLHDGGVEGGVTLKLGPFSLIDSRGFDPLKLRDTIARRLRPVAEAHQTSTLHAVGGAWRSLAQMHMAVADYPLRVVHQYAMSAGDARDMARFVARQSKQSLDKTPGVSRKRAETLPYAALVLEGLIDHLGLKQISFSAWGVREGLLFEALGESQLRDPLLAGAEVLGARQGISPTLPAFLEAWIAPIHAALPPAFGARRDAVLCAAACRYADIGVRLHPDHRVDLAFDQVLRAPIPGQSHAERAFLACAINARYGGGVATPQPGTIERLLDEGQRAHARALGLAIRLGCDLSGRSAQLLANATAAVKDGSLVLTARPGFADLLLGEQTRRRGKALAEAMGLKLDIQWASGAT